MYNYEVEIRLYVSAEHEFRNYDIITFGIRIQAKDFENAVAQALERFVVSDYVLEIEIAQVNAWVER